MPFLTQKSDLEKTTLIPDEQIPWPRNTTGIMRKNNIVLPNEFGSRRPVIQKPFQTKGVTTSIIALVPYGN